MLDGALPLLNGRVWWDPNGDVRSGGIEGGSISGSIGWLVGSGGQGQKVRVEGLGRGIGV